MADSLIQRVMSSPFFVCIVQEHYGKRLLIIMSTRIYINLLYSVILGGHNSPSGYCG